MPTRYPRGPMSMFQTTLRHAVATALESIGANDVEAVVEPSARPEFGDWSTPAPLRAAKVLRRSPMAIAAELCTALNAAKVEHVREWNITPPGYVNAQLDESTWAPMIIATSLALSPAVALAANDKLPTGRWLVEHTAINTNKAAHLGHLRNACIGDTVTKVLRRIGHNVEVNNYIDDTGVQVADIIVGLRELNIPQNASEPFDQFCSRVYVEVTKRQAEDPALVERRRATLRELEEPTSNVAQFGKELAAKIVTLHLATMAQFGIHYDLLTWESDILALGFWQRAFTLLRDSGAIVQATMGKNAGCWVMPWDEGHATNESDRDDDEAKVIVKSDGVATYTGKDIAYQLWKFGLLGQDFSYRLWNEAVTVGTYSTTADTNATADKTFGGASRVINVIDARQAYPQQIVKQALQRLGHVREAENSVHLAYEVVALSANAAKELGIADEGRTLYAFSGRKGIEVRVDDLLATAVEHVRDKAKDETSAQRLAAGAIRYYMEKFSLTQIIAFDFTEALRTTGDTGVYLQYAHARAASILRKVSADDAPIALTHDLLPEERALLHRIDGYEGALHETAAMLSPSVLATYAYDLASALSDFYEHTPPIVREENGNVRRFRRALVAATKATLGDALTTLGIDAPDYV